MKCARLFVSPDRNIHLVVYHGSDLIEAQYMLLPTSANETSLLVSVRLVSACRKGKAS